MLLMKLETVREKIRYSVLRVRAIFIGKPKVFMLFMAIGTVLLVCLFEYGRAWFYMRSVESYRSSANMQMLQQDVDKLVRSVELMTPPYFCHITAPNLLTSADSAYVTERNSELTPEKIVSRLRDQFQLVDHPPAYSTLAPSFLLIKKAQSESAKMHDAVLKLKELVTDDVRSGYCLELTDALSQVYFIKDIQTPEGVSALLPGQVEDFQVRVSKTKETLLSMRFPEPFTTQHTDFIRILNEIAVSLRQNENNYVEFARRLGAEKLEIDGLLETIRSQTTDLQQRPMQIALTAQVLYGSR